MKTRDVEAPREYYYKTNHESFRAFDGITKTSPRRGRFVTHFHGADATADVQSNHSRSIYRRYSFTNATKFADRTNVFGPAPSRFSPPWPQRFDPGIRYRPPGPAGPKTHPVLGRQKIKCNITAPTTRGAFLVLLRDRSNDRSFDRSIVRFDATETKRQKAKRRNRALLFPVLQQQPQNSLSKG